MPNYYERLDKAVGEAAAAIRRGGDFYKSVNLAVRGYRVEWQDVQQGLAERSAESRAAQKAAREQLQQMAVAPPSPIVEEIKKLTAKHRAKESTAPPPPDKGLFEL